MAASEATTLGGATWADPVLRRKMMVRAVTVSAIGTTIEWYDFFLYGAAAALVFPQKFFPRSDPFVGQLLSFTTFSSASSPARSAPRSSGTSATASAAKRCSSRR